MIKSKILKCITALILLPCAQLSATWTTPQAISGPDVEFVSGDSLDVNNSNNAIAVWNEPPGFAADVYASFYTFGVGWSAPELISSTALTPFGGRVFISIGDPNVTMNESNQALVVFEGSEFVLPEQENIDGVFAVTRSANGAWSQQERVSARNLSNFFRATDIRGVINDAGLCFGVWKEMRRDNNTPPTYSYIMGNFKQIGGGWGTPFQIAGPFSLSFTELTPSAAMNNNGDIVVVWLQDLAGNNTTNVATYDGTTNTWSLPLALPPLFESGLASQNNLPYAAIDPNGNAVVTWPYRNDDVFRIYAASFTKATGWGASIILDEVSPLDGEVSNPFVVMDPFGTATVVWDRLVSESQVFSSVLPLGGTWSTPVAIAPVSSEFDTTKTLTPADNDSNGNVIVIYNQAVNSGYSLMSIANYKGLGWQAPEFITGFDREQNENIKYGSCGFAVSQWTERDENNDVRVFVSLNFNLATPPQDFSGKQCCEKFLTQRVCFNELTWTVSECFSSYILYRNGVLIATIPSAQAGFFRDVACGPAVYTLIGVSSISSTQSPPVTVTLP